MKKITCLYTSLIFLAGCASQKQSMPEENYNQFASMEVAADACLKANYLTYQETGQAHSDISILLNSWSYDAVKYSNLLMRGAQIANTNKLTQANCNITRAKIYQYTLEVQRYQQQLQIASQQRAIADQQALQYLQNSQNSLPKTTYCNRYGTQTICNTY